MRSVAEKIKIEYEREIETSAMGCWVRRKNEEEKERKEEIKHLLVVPEHTIKKV